VLIEPLVEFEADLQAHTADRRGEYVLAAVGAEEGTATIQLGELSLEHSTLRGSLSGAKSGERGVPVRTLDGLSKERKWEPPFGLKVDAEGFEDQVIEGAGQFLLETQFVIAEVNAWPRFRGGYAFSEFIQLMASKGFELWDVLDGQKGERNGRLHYIDCLFCRG
jgi:FkbM family methyltransferase